MIYSTLRLLPLLLISVLTLGCEGTATGLDSANIQTRSDLKLTHDASSGPLVRIDFPIGFAKGGQEAFRKIYNVAHSLSHEIEPEAYGRIDKSRIADATVARTVFFLQYFYAEVARRLPPGTVYLNPYVIEALPKAGVNVRYIHDVEPLPTPIVIDFFTYSDPDWGNLMDADFLTFGDVITPLLKISHDFGGIRRILIETAPFYRPDQFYQQYGRAFSVFGDDENIYSAYDESEIINYENPQYIYANKLIFDPLVIHQNPITTDAPSEESIQSLFAPYADLVYQAVHDVLSWEHANVSFQFSRNAAWKRFYLTANDADGLLPKPENAPALDRFLERLRDKEREMLVRLSSEFLQDPLVQEFSTNMRTNIENEYRFLEDRRGLARKKNFQTAIGVFTSLLGGAAIGTGNSAAAQRSMNLLSIQAEYADSINSKIDELTQAFELSNLGTAFTLGKVTVELGENESVQVQGYGAAKRRYRDLIQKKLSGQ